MTSSVNPSSNAMDTLTVTITDTRTIDGLIFAANSAKLSPEDYATWLLTQDGKRYADANSYGIVTSAGFFARFTPTEYANILAASEDTTVVPDPIGGIPTAEEQKAYDDALVKFAAIPDHTPEDIAEYEAAVAAYQAACTPDNQAEIDAAEKQNADAAEIKALIDELTAAERVALDDQRVTDALALLVERNLLEPNRPAEIVKYDRPFPEVNGDA